MKNAIIIISIAGLIGIHGCGNENKQAPETDLNTSGSSPIQSENNNSENIQATPDQQPAVVPAVQNTEPAVPVNGSGALNPPHGEPGHRCEINVGAPLNSASATSSPAAPAAIQVSPGGPTTPSINMTSGNPSPVQSIQVTPPVSSGPTPAGMNPPHGEPGHDCAIPVGSPLKK